MGPPHARRRNVRTGLVLVNLQSRRRPKGVYPPMLNSTAGCQSEQIRRMSDKKAGAQPTEIDSGLRQRFLHGMSHAACTVNVVTTDGAAGRHGVTVSAMVSVSADTPQPTLLVCIHHLSPVAEALLENGVFCVNVLGDDQVHISYHFAGLSPDRGPA